MIIAESVEKRERAIIVGVVRKHNNRWTTEEYLEELALLADTAGADVVEKVLQDRDTIDPAYFIGRGKVRELRGLAKQMNVNVILFDDDLSPAQVKNLEKSCGKKIVDRSGLILDIFAKRAKTKEAKTQVELAQLKYMLPRLTRQWTHLSRQEGGIGVRGPGETQLEVDRRAIRRRIGQLTKELDKIHNQRVIRRKHREDVYKVALVGYTNVGKSTILNALTRADVFVENRLFATLDPTIRVMSLPNIRKVLLIDTVGFIRKLPHHLIASFMSTLQETADANLLLHIVDVSHPYFEDQIETVNGVLKSLRIDTKPRVVVFNKVDKLQHREMLPQLRTKYSPSVAISATRGINMDSLLEEIREFAEHDLARFEVQVHIDESRIISKIHALSEVVAKEYLDSCVQFTIRSNFANMQKIKRLQGVTILAEREDCGGEDPKHNE